MEIIKESQPKARKSHTCDFCNQKIIINEVYHRQTIVNDGDIYEWVNHKHCLELAIKLKMYDEYRSEGLTESEFCDYIVEYYLEHHDIARNSKLPPFNEILEFVIKKIII